MESLRKLGLLDADGKPVEDRVSRILNALLPRFRRRFPALRMTVSDGDARRPLDEILASTPWWRTWILNPLVLPIDARSRVCE